MAKYEKRLDRIQNRFTGDNEERWVSNGQIVWLEMFDCKTRKMEDDMMVQFSEWFAYLENCGKVDKYRIGKQSVILVFEIKDWIFRERVAWTTFYDVWN